MAFAQCAIIYKKHSTSIYANYFIIFSISSFALLNSIAYMTDGDSISKFQGWDFSPAIFQIGIFQLAIFLYSVIAIFKNNNFKASMLLFFAIYTIMDSFTVFNGSQIQDNVLGIFLVENLTAFIALIFYRILYR
jgi:hypothetical protein